MKTLRATSAFLIVLLLLAPAAVQAQTTIFVDASASGAGDGSSWPDAYVNLQDALDEVNANAGTDYEIRVAEGVYFPDQDSDGDHAAGDESAFFTLSRDGVELLGGHPAGGGTRDPDAHVTVLSGDIDGNDTKNGDGVTENASDISGANSNSVLDIDGATSSTVIDGVVITAGDGDTGGGLVNDSGSPVLVEIILAGNRAAKIGGGMYNAGGSGTAANPTLVNVTFTGNRATLAEGCTTTATLP